MKRIVLVLSTAAAVLAGASGVFAAPFNAKDVAADPALLFHLDCDALRASSVGQSFLADQEVQDKLAAVGAIFGFDVTKQLHGLTVYTTEEHPKDGALIIYADFDSTHLLTIAKLADDFHSVTNGSHVIYTWLDDKKKSKTGERMHLFGAIEGHRVVLGENGSHLADALDVIKGAAPSFSGKKGLPEADAGESVVLAGRMVKFDFDDPNDKAAIFKMSKAMRLKLSEQASNITATVHLEAADTDTATQMANIAQGLVALLKLQQGDANATKLANAIKIKQDEAVVGLTLSVPSSELIGVMKDAQKKAEQKEQNAKQSTNAPSESK